MKKVLSILVILMVAVVGRTYADDGVAWTEVYTADEFYSVIKNNHSANVKLGADIDLSGHDASGDCIFNFGFSGRIDGGYTNSRGTELNHKLMNSKNDLLFNYLENAEISNLTIYNCKFDGWDTHSGWLGTEAKYSKFTDIEILNCNGHGDNNLFDNDCMGGLLGSAKHCTFTRVLSINSSIETDGERAGLIVGKDENSTFTDCVAGPTSSIWADGNANNAYCGGICGDCTGSTLNNCTNMALVCSKDDRTGGVIGFGSNTKLNGCTNSGIVCNAEKSAYNTLKSTLAAKISSITMFSAGGVGFLFSGTAEIVGLLIEYAGIIVSEGFGLNCAVIVCGKEAVEAELISRTGASLGSKTLIGVSAVQVAFAVTAIAATALASYGFYHDFYKADEIGGIAGKLDNGSVADQCVNLGAVECEDVECGGIVGYLDGSAVRNCLNRGLVNGENRTGGIAGYCNNNSVLEYNVNLAGFNALGGYGGFIYDESDHGDLTARSNYYVAGTSEFNDNNGCYGEPVSHFATGQVAWTLNTLTGDTVWHQNLGESMYPIPRATAKKVTDTTTKPATCEKVYSPGDFIIAVSNPWAIVSLEADLDMSGEKCVDLSTEEIPFHGKIYGNGHKISNFSFEVPKNEGNNHHHSIFPYAEGAEFHNFIIDNFHFTQKSLSFVNKDDVSQHTEAFLVAESHGCTYDSIAIKNSTIYKHDWAGIQGLREVAGVACLSNNDTFIGCSIDKNCTLQALTGTSMADAMLGGIAAVAKGSKFSYCYSGASLWSDDNKVGGIVGELEDGSIDHCFNSGTINSHERVGGIVGHAENTPVTYCVNTGLLADGKDTRQDWRGGIIGRLKGSGASKAYDMNFGTLNYMASKCEAIGKLDDGAVDGGHNYYYCQYNGDHKDNESSYKEENSIYRYEKMLSGEFAYKAVDADGNPWVYQDIDNNTFATHLPTPIPAAGKVYSNILCDGTQSYSNKYNSTGAHTGTADQFGYCTICGKQLGAANAEIHIADSLELIQFAYNVNRGADFSGSTVYLDNDINLAGCDFPMIGNTTNPFEGTFDGQGHRILNMTLHFAQGCVGLLGCAAGNNTIIKNIIIDSSCSVTSVGEQYGVAGLLGGVQSTSGSECKVTIENCGNEASVSGYGNVAGLLGGVYNNDATIVNINNCYNTGAIGGNSDSESGSIVGYARKHTSIRNTYNCGTVGGTDDWLTFAYTGVKGYDGTIENCYTTVSGDKTPNVSKIDANQVSSGELCSMLNKADTVFSQIIGTDAYPVPGAEGLSGTSVLHITTADELVAFATSVNSGNSYYGSIIDLDNDIDFNGGNFTPIGNESHYFAGTFNGQGHRIKNMALYSTTGYLGLFGVVSGSDCVVKNIIIDSSCSVTSKSGKGVAGLIGCVSSANGSACNLTIENCGNEANVIGVENVAGLLGGVYNNDATVVNISNCYNTGTIIGNKYSATGSIVGWTRKHTSIRNTYNTGTVGGTNDWLTFACTQASGFDGTIKNCYTTVTGDKTQNVKKTTAYTVASGDLCNLLNNYASSSEGSETSVFTQTAGEDHPVPGTEGLTGDPENYWMEVSTADEFKRAADMTSVNSGSPVRIRLAADIDLSSLSAISSGDEKGYLFATNYNGIIDGNGHALKNSTHALFYRTSWATLKNITLDGFKVTSQTSLIARTSGSSEFDSITVKNSSIKYTGDKINNFGMIVGYSNGDDISYCTLEKSCSVTAKRQRTGGLVGEMYGGSITYCQNSATIEGDADYIGGIVAYSGKSGTGAAARIAYCLNTGTINGDDECGGIVGQYYDGRISNCVNTGTISSKDGDNHSNVGGIVGKLCSATCESSINFGSVEKAKSQNAQFAIYGGKDGTITATDNEYYCDVKGKHFDTGMLYDDLMSGKYAYAKGWLCQDIDNGTFTATAYPVPVPAAGKVYSNILCDGVQSFSNKYQSTEAHESQMADDVCAVCGSKVLHIKDATELSLFIYDVNTLGKKYDGYIIYLDSDIDWSEMRDLYGDRRIGDSSEHPFIGIFDGQGHRIKNITLYNSEATGFFGYVAGRSTIRNVIIDSSCLIEQTSSFGAAGLVGGIYPYNGLASNVTIENCGNEANITGTQNVAGILGGVYNNDENNITIRNCYNTGVITNLHSSDDASASICGYARKNYTITNCYSSGSVVGKQHILYCAGSSHSSTSSVSNCYDVSGPQDGVTQITADDVRMGILCQKLNADTIVFAQDLENDSYPVPGSDGLHYTRSMSSQWGTIVLPFDVDISDTGYCTFYQIESVSGSLLTLQQLEGTLAAGTPALVCMVDTTMVDEDGKYQLWLSPENSTVNTNIYNPYAVGGLTLTGTYDLIESLTHIYYIHDNKFWYADDPIGILPFRAYLDGTIEGVDCLSFGKGGIVDGITSAEVETANDQEIYNLAGQRLNAPKKGQINIIGGRKVLVK